MRVIAFYLPQFHTIPENDIWWGRGFTEWVNVRNAKPLFKNHLQPVKPLDNNYYSLLDKETIKWQIKLAKEYDIYGFCFYHYWFSGHKLLEKPMEIFLKEEDINHPYCICWANETWTNAWKSDGNTQILIEQKYGDKKEWKSHFEYLQQFFLDENYIKEDNKPLFVIYRPESIPCLNEMLDYWDNLAKEIGFDGLTYAYQQITFDLQTNKDDSKFRYNIEYQPAYARYDLKIKNKSEFKKYLFDRRQDIINLLLSIQKKFNINIYSMFKGNNLTLENYSELCECIINRRATNEKSVAGFFVGWDNTPRRGTKGTVCIGSTPEQFEYYFEKQVENVQKNYSNDFIFLFAWNEWAEGGYLEPTEHYQYRYLEIIKKVLNKESSK